LCSITSQHNFAFGLVFGILAKLLRRSFFGGFSIGLWFWLR
jgi:hypothetical protein